MSERKNVFRSHSSRHFTHHVFLKGPNMSTFWSVSRSIVVLGGTGQLWTYCSSNFSSYCYNDGEDWYVRLNFLLDGDSTERRRHISPFFQIIPFVVVVILLYECLRQRARENFLIKFKSLLADFLFLYLSILFSIAEALQLVRQFLLISESWISQLQIHINREPLFSHQLFCTQPPASMI